MSCARFNIVAAFYIKSQIQRTLPTNPHDQAESDGNERRGDEQCAETEVEGEPGGDGSRRNDANKQPIREDNIENSGCHTKSFASSQKRSPLKRDILSLERPKWVVTTY
jgi:hypothetical protein